MRQTRPVSFRGASHARRINDFRRRAWVQRRASGQNVEPPRPTGEYIPGEFPEPPKSKAWALLRRGVGLASDLVVLILAAPFFAGWFLYRLVRRVLRGED
ncbi:hypothetical protein HYPP_01693 [Hyphomicrobium sp. ghe19]|nr:hypothetical protein HYPP_01693 [Hyphomicrobium sp. ghe19]